MEQVKNTIKASVDRLATLGFEAWFWQMAILVLVFPFMLLALYNHPAADDFCYVHMVERKGLWATQVHWYTQWSGRYTATFLQTFNPLAYKSILGYQLETMAVLGLLVWSVYRIIQQWTSSGTNDYSTWLLTFGILFLYFLQMPSLVQGVFWLSGALTYQIANIAMLLGLAWLYRMEAREKKNGYYLLIVSLLAIVVCGANETSMLEWLFLLSIGIGFRILTERRLPMRLLFVCLVSIVASAMVLFSPGNSIRSSYFPQHHDLLLSLQTSFQGTLMLLGQWTPELILWGCVLLPLVPINKKTSSTLSKQWGWLYVMLIPAIVFVGVFPACWSMGSMPPARTLNVVFLLFLLSSLFFVLWLRTVMDWNPLPVYSRLLILFVLFVFLLPVNNYRTACMDLLSGRASRYSREMNQRYDLLKGNRSMVILEPLSVRPVSLFSSELEENSDDWKNTCAADYFHVDSITVRPVDE